MITGSNGLLGQKIVKQLAALNVTIVATSKGENRISLPANAKYLSLDVTDVEAVIKTVQEEQPTAIIHAAAMTNVDLCESEREMCYALNVEATRNVAKAAKQVDAYVVHISTDFIFDGMEGPYSEDGFPNPLCYYGETKWESEEVLSTSGVNFSILRTMLLFGVEENGKSNIVLWAKSALEKGEPMKVVDDQFRSPTLADNLAEACINAVGKRASGVYHVSGDGLMSIREMVHEIATFWNLDESNVQTIQTAELGQPASRPPVTGFILDRAKEELEYEPLTFKQALQVMQSQLSA